MLTATSSVKDIMQTDLVTIGPSDRLKDAMELLMDNHVSGLPVVDAGGRCVGVLSMTDILGLECEQADTATNLEEIGSYFDPDEQRWENMRFAGGTDELPDASVRDVMSTDVITVQMDEPLRSAAEMMVERRVHRLLVVGRQGQLHGLVAALDLVRLVAES